MGMTIIKHSNGYEISMDSYIEDILKMYGERVKEFMKYGIVPEEKNTHIK